MADSVIQIRSEDIVENLDAILEHSTLFQTNSNLESLSCYIFYTENRKLLNYKKYEIQVNNNKMSRKELLALVLKNNKHYSKTFDLTGIYKYEASLEETKIKDFCKKPLSFDFLTSYKNIQDIPFQPCIELFNENNCVLLFFSRKQEDAVQTKPKNPNPNPNKNKNIKPKLKNNKTHKKVKFNLKEPTSTTSNKTKKTI